MTELAVEVGWREEEEEGIVVNCTDPSGDKKLAGPSDEEDEDDEGEPTGPHMEELTAY